MGVILFSVFCFFVGSILAHGDHDTTDQRSNELLYTGRWTEWINVDRPTGSGDFETRGMIRLHSVEICSSYEHIIAAECKETDSDVIFHDQAITPAGDRLKLWCTKNGLQCLNKDQVSGSCHDYSIRFLCNVGQEDEDRPQTTQPNHKDPSSIFSNIDYRIYLIIALVPITILLLRIWCSFIRRKRRLARRRRSSRGGQSSENINEELSQPPPSYIEIFGAGQQPSISQAELYLSRYQGRVCEQCLRKHTSRGNQRSSTETSESSPTQINNSSEIIRDPPVSNTEVDTNNTSVSSVDDAAEPSSSEVTLTINERTRGVATDAYLCCVCKANRCVLPVYDNPGFKDDSGKYPRPPGMHVAPNIARNTSQTSLCSIPPPSYAEALDILKNSEA